MTSYNEPPPYAAPYTAPASSGPTYGYPPAPPEPQMAPQPWPQDQNWSAGSEWSDRTVQTGSDGTDSSVSDKADSSVSDKAADAAEAGKQAVGDVASTAKEQAAGVAQEAVTQARDVVGQARDQLREQAGTQHANLVGNLHQLADHFGQMSRTTDEPSLATDLVGQAGGHARTVASWLESREPADLLDEVRSFARRRPGAFLVGALVAGVAAGRLTRGVADVHRDSASDDHSTDTTPVSTDTTAYESAPDVAFAPQQDNGFSVTENFVTDNVAAEYPTTTYADPNATGYSAGYRGAP